MGIFENIKTIAVTISGLVAATAGTYKMLDSFGYNWNRPVLTWAEEYFEITNAPVNGEFRIVVAREKHRDDCEVDGFKISIRDSKLTMFQATPSIASFAGPASDHVDMFAYNFFIQENDYYMIATGPATFIARITYECPEGIQYVDYPEDLHFEILPIEQ